MSQIWHRLTMNSHWVGTWRMRLHWVGIRRTWHSENTLRSIMNHLSALMWNYLRALMWNHCSGVWPSMRIMSCWSWMMHWWGRLVSYRSSMGWLMHCRWGWMMHCWWCRMMHCWWSRMVNSWWSRMMNWCWSMMRHMKHKILHVCLLKVLETLVMSAHMCFWWF